MCHFHQERIIQRYITRKPKLEASQALNKIMQRITQTNETIFTKNLARWYETYKDFLSEKTLNEATGKESFTHIKLVFAYRSLGTNLSYLFTYKNHKYLGIHNTTNHLDGELFAPMKMLLKIHRGIGIEMKKKLIVDYLENIGK